MIRPLRDVIVAIPIEDTRTVGVLVMPDNYKQGLRTHYKAAVLFAGPKSECEQGTVIHVSETWGEEFLYLGKKVWIGRARDINGICEGELAHGKFSD